MEAGGVALIVGKLDNYQSADRGNEPVSKAEILLVFLITDRFCTLDKPKSKIPEYMKINSVSLERVKESSRLY